MREWISVYQPKRIVFLEDSDGKIHYELRQGSGWAWSCTLCDADSRGTWEDKAVCVEAALRHGRRKSHLERAERYEEETGVEGAAI